MLKEISRTSRGTRDRLLGFSSDALISTGTASMLTVVVYKGTDDTVNLRATGDANDQSWFWTPEWQAAEREADQNLRDGDYEDFDTIDDFVASL